ncbi:MAG: hypothetical protein CVT81_04065 [Alphaproteobacteria bacterium HGW-Alphaproteobacteria-3]|nr:MAG: hypothetical protein CVT81_04065 [Alphaproteobacteria bacterium HGW-Alphaproteobacteria-3]
MSATTHKVRVVDARRIKHPQFPEIEKHYFLVRAKDLPNGIRTDANARDPNGLNRRVYREVHESLLGRDTTPGTFDLMNKGIVCLADKVRRIDDSNYEIVVRDGQGIVDGGHTYKIICDAQEDPALPDEQHVEFQVRTGITDSLITDIARGLNTGMQVKDHSIANLDGKYDWIKEDLSSKPYVNRIAWRESDDGDYDVRDLICVLEAMNIFDFPNDCGVHPVAAYEKWSIPTNKFSKDFDVNKDDLSQSKYLRLRPLLHEALVLYDRIRRDFRDVYNNEDLGSAGKLDIVEEAKGTRKFDFPFAGLQPAKYRLTKGALFPIFAAFRNKVEIDPKIGTARWSGGFLSVLDLWDSVAPELARQTKQATKDYGHKPDAIGKNRGHWTNMHQTVELHILRDQLKQQKKHPKR